MKTIRVSADFNGLFGDILCLSHADTCLDESGNLIHLSEGLRLIAFDEDLDESGNRDDLIACGYVETAPAWLQCKGSKWILRIDSNGVHHQSELRSEPQ
jgi:hypothetical protein